MEKKLKVLHFEDQEGPIDTVGALVEDQGYVYVPVTTQEQVHQSIKSIASGGVIVITDLHMKTGRFDEQRLSSGTRIHIDGDNVAKIIKRAYPNTPVVMYTGDAESAIRIKHTLENELGRTRVGIIEVLSKTVSPQELLDVLERSRVWLLENKMS